MYQSRFAKRFIVEDGQEARVAAIVEPVIEDLGFQLVRIRISSRDGCTVQIMAEQPSGEMNVEDCALISRALSPIFDVEDPIQGMYHLEVSSPGIDRPLVRAQDFIAWIGYEIKIETSMMIEGRKRYRGRLLKADDTQFDIRLVDAGDGKEMMTFLYHDLSDAKLVTTDDLIRTALKRSKAQKAQIDEKGIVSFEGDHNDYDDDNNSELNSPHEEDHLSLQ